MVTANRSCFILIIAILLVSKIEALSLNGDKERDAEPDPNEKNVSNETVFQSNPQLQFVQGN